MGKFFINLQNYNLYTDYSCVLDWLLNDNRFLLEEGWTSGYVGSFTKKVLKLPHINENNYKYGTRKSLSFNSKNQMMIIISSNQGQGKDFVRHIRNAIAHGNVKLSNIKSLFWIELLDFNKKKEQTAYIFVPLDIIKDIYNIYQKIEKKIKFKEK